MISGEGVVKLSKIFTVSITEQVANAIRIAIKSGEYEPGKNLSESKLSEHYKVSRTPIREALKQLEKEGLVDIIPRVGTRVKKATDSELTELFTVKEALEGLAAGQLALKNDKVIMEKLEENILLMEQAVAEKNQELYVEANKYFHDNILVGANNSKITFLLDLLLNQIPYQKYVHITIDAPNRMKMSLKEHRHILNKIKSGDAFEAEMAMRNHVKASEKKLKERIKGRISEKK